MVIQMGTLDRIQSGGARRAALGTAGGTGGAALTQNATEFADRDRVMARDTGKPGWRDRKTRLARFLLLPKGQILASKRTSEAGHLGEVQWPEVRL